MADTATLTFQVKFLGVPVKFVARVERMLREDIAYYPECISMAGAEVTVPDNRPKQVAAPRPKAVPKHPRGKR